MKDFLQEIIEYNYFYNQKLVEYVKIHDGKVSDKAKLLLSHLINAQKIWNSRILNLEPIFGVWEILPLKKLKELNDENYESSKKILQTEDLEKIIQYRTSRGEEFSNKLKDIIFHYLNHATYHRAQIATEFKNAGLEHLTTDYIFYKRS